MKEKISSSPIFSIVSRILFAPIIIFGLYVQFHGDYGPGGGFQAGVIIAAAFILYSMIFGLKNGETLVPVKINRYLMCKWNGVVRKSENKFKAFIKPSFLVFRGQR